MSITATDLVMYGSASNPSDDATVSGGAIDKTRRAGLTQLAQSSTLSVVSDGADQRTIVVNGRDATGTYRTETMTLNNTTAVTGQQLWERVLDITLGGPDGARTVTVTASANAATVCTIPPTEVGCFTLFRNAASGQASVSRYEKCFQSNNNASITLNQAQVTLTADPSARITIGLAPSLNDSSSVANRLGAPTGITFASVGVAQSVPGGAIPSGSAVGVWIKLALQASDAPQKATFTTQVSGSSV